MNEQEKVNEDVLESVRNAESLSFSDSDCIFNIVINTNSDIPAYLDLDDVFEFTEVNDFDELISVLSAAKNAFIAIRKWDVH